MPLLESILLYHPLCPMVFTKDNFTTNAPNIIHLNIFQNYEFKTNKSTRLIQWRTYLMTAETCALAKRVKGLQVTTPTNGLGSCCTCTVTALLLCICSMILTASKEVALKSVSRSRSWTSTARLKASSPIFSLYSSGKSGYALHVRFHMSPARSWTFSLTLRTRDSSLARATFWRSWNFSVKAETRLVKEARSHSGIAQ